MTSDLLGVSISGLKASQVALRTSGHNIANANTPGYSRQTVSLGSTPGSFFGKHFLGNGVNVSAVERVASSFVTEQLQQDTTLHHQLNAYNENIRQINTLLSDNATGLSQGLESFFSSLQNGADNPTSIPSRQLIVSESENIATRFNLLYDRINSINEGVNGQLSVAVAEVNALSTSIADLNMRITDAQGGGGDALPNDLLDQRDEALRRLSELVSIQTFDQGNSQLNVMIGSGQPLVIGGEARNLSLIDGEDNSTTKDIVYRDETQGDLVVTDRLTGGKIGGVINFRDQVLSTAFNEIGRVAIALADEMNRIHQQGLDLNNNFGGLFFNDINAADVASNRVLGNASNQPPANQVMSVEIRDVTQLTASDYSMVVESSSNLYRITRLSDGEEVSSGIISSQLPSSIEFDGLTLNLTAGTFQSGDQFLIQPTRLGASGIASALTDPREISFASPVRTDATLGNTGSGEISPGEVLSLEDAEGNPLALFATPGQMSPPLIVKFTTPTTYDVLDNTDPGNPVDLVPPLRHQQYIPGTSNSLFSADPGVTRVVSQGASLGLPAGRLAVAQAALQPAGANPVFTTTNFSGANQFTFDIAVNNTLGGANDGTFTVTINEPNINSNTNLLTAINNDLSASDVRAYIDDNGNLAFRLQTPGAGDISVQNYGGAAGGDTLFGFAVESTAFTTVAGANGVSGSGVLVNNYPAEVVSIQTTDPGTSAVTTERVTLAQNASARQMANVLNNVPGVSANAFNRMDLSNLQLTHTEPLQINLNGQDLLEYNVDPALPSPVLSALVPDPAADPTGFNDYVAEQINNNSTLSSQGIYAVSGVDSLSGRPELQIYSTLGDDFQVALTAASGETLDVSDGSENTNVVLTGAGNSVASSLVVGGKLDVTLSNNVTLSTQPSNSQLFGDSTADNFAQSAYTGIQASIQGTPSAGDSFTLNFNLDAENDNRNALKLADLDKEQVVDGKSTLASGYGKLVEEVGIRTNESNISTEAAKKVLEQTTNLRSSISGVNLDEEAAALIKNEQVYAANARAISVARELFNRLLEI